jgi:lysozyme
MASIGIVRGAYHFLHANSDAALQATFFLLHAKAAGLGPGDLVAVDVEQSGMDGQPPANLWAAAVRFALVVHDELGAWPVAYTDISLAQAAPGLDVIAGCPLWLADPSGAPPVPVGPWRSIAFEQTGQRGVDTDVFHGDAAQLAALAIPHPGGNVTDIPLNLIGCYTDAAGALYVVGTDAHGILCEVKRHAPGQWGEPYPIAGKAGVA